MIWIAFRFTAGRFHATPWGHHVNEGVAEWPPSPWRFVRALVAVLHQTDSGIDRNAAWSALTRLTPPPSFTLPPASMGHTRHYLSLNQVDRAKTALAFDTFVVVPPADQVVLHWPVELSDDERAALRDLVIRLSYFGRADAQCDVEWLEQEPSTGPNCVPSDGSAAQDTETVRVLCPRQGFTREDVERTTTTLQREGWTDPPGTRWVFYRRTAGALRPVSTPRRQVAPKERRPTMAEFALGGTVLPLFVDAVRVAEQIRAAALSRHGEPSMTLSGKAADGSPLRGQHRHAHYIPDARGHAKRITHVIVWATDGFSHSEQQALSQISYLVQEDNRPTLDVVLSGFGDPLDFAAECRLIGPVTRWRSRTPFVLPRHIKRSSESAEQQLIRELAHRGYPAPMQVRPLAGAALTDREGGPAALTRWLEFETRRRRRRPTTAYGGFEIEFNEPQIGPIVVGFGSHFGLGQFEAVAPVCER
jgi:CRISPR-associated protein Csb2